MVVLVWEKHVGGDNWSYMRHEAAKRWPKLSKADLDFIDGNRARLVETLRKTYGSFVDEVHRDVDEWMQHGVINLPGAKDRDAVASGSAEPPKSAGDYQHVSPNIPSIRGQSDTIATSGSDTEKKDPARWQTPAEELQEKGVDLEAEANNKLDGDDKVHEDDPAAEEDSEDEKEEEGQTTPRRRRRRASS